MTDHLEKYIRLNIDFPNKAGKLDSVLHAQKRLVTKISRTAGISQDVKDLLLLVAEGFDVSQDLLQYMKTTLQDVANDVETLSDGAMGRNIIETQGTLISDLMQSRDAAIDEQIERIKKKRNEAIGPDTKTA